MNYSKDLMTLYIFNCFILFYLINCQFVISKSTFLCLYIVAYSHSCIYIVQFTIYLSIYVLVIYLLLLFDY